MRQRTNEGKGEKDGRMVDIRRKKYEVKKRAQMSKGVWITKTQSLPHKEWIMMGLSYWKVFFSFGENQKFLDHIEN